MKHLTLPVALLSLAAAGSSQALRVCTTTPDLGSIVRAIGGDAVNVTVFAKGTEDAHFVIVRPSYVTALHRARLYVTNGLDLELGWAPALLRKARNPDVQAGREGYLDASAGIERLGILSGTVDRSMGDVHPRGNPHYLLDPIFGLRVAARIRDRLALLLPDSKADLAKRYDAFAKDMGRRMVGPELAELYPFDKLALLFEKGRLKTFLEKQKELDKLGGWLGALMPYRGQKVVADHDVWSYFTTRFGLVLAALLEPKPGVPPTSSHLAKVIRRVRANGTKVVLSLPYFDPKHARFVAAKTGAVVVRAAHQTGARPGTASYLDMIDYDVRSVARALRGEAR